MKYPQDYRQSNESNLWVPASGAADFAYSDGSAQEQYLEQCVQQATDRSSLASGLIRHIRDWSSEYHLTPKRGNLLRPLGLESVGSVLELGAGCGAVTRYLGENVDRVVAVEGSHQRAKVAALRCRDLTNVEVVCGNFQDVEFEQQFDMVTLIGVLEYSGKYIESSEPYIEALTLAKRHLKPDGVLVIAIENKLGIKYFSGCTEDHTGVYYDGIEGYGIGSNVRTFGKRELATLLNEAGLPHTKFMYPFPDYKLPDMVVVNEDSLSMAERPFLYSWVGHASFRDYANIERRKAFDEFLAIKQLESNGLLGDLANSFLVVASANEASVTSAVPSDLVLQKYSVTRRRKFMTKISVRHSDTDGLQVVRESLDNGVATKASNLNKTLEHTIEPAQPLYTGITLMERMINAIRRMDVNPLNAFQAEMAAWDTYLRGQALALTGSEEELPGDYLDCVPSNLICTDEGIKYIDREWSYRERLPVKFILYRGLFHFYSVMHPMIDACWSPMGVSVDHQGFIGIGLDSIKRGLTLEELAEYQKLEQGFLARTLPYVPKGPGTMTRQTTQRDAARKAS